MRIPSLCFRSFLFFFSTILSVPANSATLDQVTVLASAANAFSGSKPVQSVVITGTAHWTAGSTKDEGSVTLTAKATGENTAEFNFGNGARVEKQSAISDTRTCSWSGKDGVEHDDSTNCLIATIWFLPHLALQEAGLPTQLGVVGVGADTSDKTNALHIRHQLTVASTDQTVVTQVQSLSRTDLALDPASFLPTTLRYKMHTDGGADWNVEVRYSSYKDISGVEIPMHIERYLNGSLQLSMDFDSAIAN